MFGGWLPTIRGDFDSESAPQDKCLPMMSPDVFQQVSASFREQIEARLSAILAEQNWPEALKEAVEYSLMAGGKRLRPVLVLVATDVCGGNSSDALPAACAVEMIHTYSLIHDDLPSMDDDELRRGRATSHVVFGEALAILAGDALLTLAFEVLANAGTPPVITADCLRILSCAAGGAGMVGGQILDLQAERGMFPSAPTPGIQESEPLSCSIPAGSAVTTRDTDVKRRSNRKKRASDPDEDFVAQLTQIHRMKTGALITASLEMGAVVACADSKQRESLVRFGQCCGLAFQIADDLLDVSGSDLKLGKETGRDDQLGKLTYPSLIGMDASRQKAQSLVDDACRSLDMFDDKAAPLRQLARFIVERDH